MKKLLIFSFYAGITALLSACCTKKYCMGFTDINEIAFYGFTIADLASIKIVRYQPGSNLTNPIDSFTTNGRVKSQGDTILYAFLPEKMNAIMDYKVVVVNTNQTFKITDLKTSQQKCNTGAFCNDTYTNLDSYVVNNQRVVSSNFKLNK